MSTDPADTEPISEEAAQILELSLQLAALTAVITEVHAAEARGVQYGDTDRQRLESVFGILESTSTGQITDAALKAIASPAWVAGYQHGYSVGVIEGQTGKVIEYHAPNPHNTAGPVTRPTTTEEATL